MKTLRCPINRIASGARRNTSAVQYGDRQLTYLQLEQNITSYVGQLLEGGARKGRRVALVAEPSAGFIIAYFALIRIGCTACLISTRKPARAAMEEYARLKCSHILVPSDNRSRFQGVEAIQWPDEDSDGPMPLGQVEYATDAPANVMFTSGTAGEPKAVIHSVGNHHYSAKGSNLNIRLAPGDGWLLSLPVYHVAGLSIPWRCFEAGATIVIPAAGVRLPQAILTTGVSHISCVPSQLSELMEDATARRKLRKFKAILLGGSPMPADLMRRICRAGLPVYASYGLTEMSSQVATTRCLRSAEDVGRARVLAYRQVRIGPDEEIQVKGPMLCLGIWKAGRLKPVGGKDGWYRTRDRGRLSRKNELQVLGRMDNMFISGGENIFPEEIERILMGFEEIGAAAVLPVPSVRYGQRPVGVVQFREGRNLTAEELRGRLQGRLEKFKVPDAFYRWPPKLSNEGLKVDRKRLTAQIKPRHLIR
ncbi:MAG: o-succinylbenzoate--CoA ligase [Candidatus Omnitrophica bacterium]|nr:o-succinylbenzoate--CoA ligase [Candidatus Omnitrophota bacterium]